MSTYLFSALDEGGGVLSCSTRFLVAHWLVIVLTAILVPLATRYPHAISRLAILGSLLSISPWLLLRVAIIVWACTLEMGHVIQAPATPELLFQRVCAVVA